jgi:hypothetical protein
MSLNLLDVTTALAITRMRQDELEAKAERARLVAEALNGADRRPRRRSGLVFALVALALGGLLAVAVVPRVVGATAGHKPRPVLVRHVSPESPPHGQIGGRAHANARPTGSPRTALAAVQTFVARALAWVVANALRVAMTVAGWPRKL